MDEALYSATYVDNYIDSVENLPDDVQRHLSRIRDIDVQYRNLLRDVDHYYDLWRSLQNCGESNIPRRARSVTRMQQSLIQAQELGDEKMQIVTQLQELIDHKTRQLDTDQKNLDIKEEKEDVMHMQMDECGAPTPQKQTRTQSPARVGDLSTLSGAIANGYGASGSNSAGGGNSTPNSERSVGGSNMTTSGNNANGNSGLLNSSSLENQRSNSKRSRRRNDTVGNMELGGNESNSANEGGSNGNDRSNNQKSSSVAASQKKSGVQNMAGSAVATSAVTGSGSGSGNGSGSGTNHSGKKKKRKARGAGAQSSAQANAREETPPPDPIDPDEPTYCVCNQISFGEMILCDNDLCPIEWFHFSCVSLVLKPKGKWYCPNCRGDRPNLMKPKAQFLKELERYNKEKEEKT
ncbi:inhibitor of growth protein 1 isoform X2 [Musca domestica]|uniref:Inhibitor of growth protein n=1 Tax=Musca domestica TaxID=7370 RepID=A0A1I8NHZ4_MUSDO|nr:inhibitor of growth protein 1 isoform X2 [Musca domestica]